MGGWGRNGQSGTSTMVLNKKETRKGVSHAKLKHSAIREYSDHLITFQSMFSRVSHQPLKQKKVQSEVEPWWRLDQVCDIAVC